MTEERQDDPPSLETPAAWIALEDDGHGAVTLRGNEAGLRRCADVLLRCAVETPEANEYRSCGEAARDLRDLAASSAGCLSSVELLRERPAPAPARSQWRDAAGLWGCGLVVAIVAVLSLIGLGVIVGVIRSQ